MGYTGRRGIAVSGRKRETRDLGHGACGGSPSGVDAMWLGSRVEVSVDGDRRFLGAEFSFSLVDQCARFRTAYSDRTSNGSDTGSIHVPWSNRAIEVE